MPSRPAVLAILAFWLGTTAFVLYRDVWPRLFASGPPPIAIDLADEASQLVPVRWAVVRGDQRVGTLTTQMSYVDADDTFRFTHKYKNVRFEFGTGVQVQIPELTTVTRVSRTGELREQSMDGKLEILLGELKLGVVEAKVNGRVTNGVFAGHCVLKSPLGEVDRDLEPVPVPGGHALNPLQPVNRIANVRPGQRWVVHEVNPLGAALATLTKEHGVNVPEKPREPLIAEVASRPENLTWGDADTPCWVIEYRGGEARAKTWVRVTDGKVLRQEAFGMGERIAIERLE